MQCIKNCMRHQLVYTPRTRTCATACFQGTAQLKQMSSVRMYSPYCLPNRRRGYAYPTLFSLMSGGGSS
eukprot:8421058-Karenia_brevis.AAC.1